MPQSGLPKYVHRFDSRGCVIPPLMLRSQRHQQIPPNGRFRQQTGVFRGQSWKRKKEQNKNKAWLRQKIDNVGVRPDTFRPVRPEMQTANPQRDDNVQNLPRIFGGRDHSDGMFAHFLQVLHCQASGGLQCLSGVRRCHSPVSSSGLHCLWSNASG